MRVGNLTLVDDVRAVENPTPITILANAVPLAGIGKPIAVENLTGVGIPTSVGISTSVSGTGVNKYKTIIGNRKQLKVQHRC